MNTFFPKKASLLFILITILAFSNVKAQTNNCGCPDPTITATEFDDYVKNYKLTFRNTVIKKARNPEWIYLPRSYFYFLNYFFSQTSFSGIKFYFTDHDKKLDPHYQLNKNQIFFSMAAAINSKQVDKDILFTFNQNAGNLLNASNSVVELSSRTNPTYISQVTYSTIINNDPKTIMKYKGNNPAKEYSHELYICKEQFLQIVLFLDANTNYNGVKFYFASYNKQMSPCIGADDIKQFTLIMCPVINRGSGPAYKQYLGFLKEKFADEFYNHGSLCPNDCSTQ